MTSGFKKNRYKMPLNLHVEKANISVHIEQLLKIEQECFPEHMQDSREELLEYFSDSNALGLLLYENFEIIGVMKGTLISEQNSPGILERYENILAQQSRTFYSDSISVLEDYRTPLLLDFFFHEIAVYMQQAKYVYFTGHARVGRGYSRMLQRRYGAKKIASYSDWHEFGEPFDYVLFEVNEFPTLPPIIYQCLKGVRFLYRALRAIKETLIGLPN